MEAHWPRRLYVPAVLAACGTLGAALAVADKVFGLVQRPLHLATFAYASLFLLIAWVFGKGIQLRPTRLVRISIYAAVLIFNVITAAYVFAWRVSADPTPLVLQSRLAEADLLLENGDKDGAHVAYMDAYKRYPDSFQVLMRMGAINYQLGDYQRARRYYTRAVETAPADSRWRALNDLGQTYWRLQLAEEAVEFYERARREGMPQTELVEWHYRMAWATFDTGDYDAAVRHYRAVADANQKYVAASYFNSACALAQKLEGTREPALRRAITGDAVENLRQAWRATRSDEERESLREGLLGGPDKRDPELEPLQGEPEFEQFLKELRAL
jgi:tetratricopeptide (TPR) repeat protein